MFAKQWKPFDQSTNKRSVGTEEEGFNKISQLVGYIFAILTRVSLSKSRTVDAQKHGTWTYLASLYYLSLRFEGMFVEPIKDQLKQVKKQFEKIAKKIIVESEVRVIQGILDVISVILRFQGSQEVDIMMQETESQSVAPDSRNANRPEAIHVKMVQTAFSIGLHRYLTTRYFTGERKLISSASQSLTSSGHYEVDAFDMYMRFQLLADRFKKK